jgi:hypothetical protein
MMVLHEAFCTKRFASIIAMIEMVKNKERNVELCGSSCGGIMRKEALN